MSRRLLRPSFLVPVLLLGLSIASEVQVSSTVDLIAALETPSRNMSIVVTQPFTLSSDIQFSLSLDVFSLKGRQNVTTEIDCDIFQLSFNGSLVRIELSDIQFRNCHNLFSITGSGVYSTFELTLVHLENCSFTLTNYDLVNFRQTTIEDFSSPYVPSGVVTITNSGDVFVSDCIFQRNEIFFVGNLSKGIRGVMALELVQSLTITNSHFDWNSVRYANLTSIRGMLLGLALGVANVQSTLLTNCTFTNHFGPYIDTTMVRVVTLISSSTTVRDCFFANNNQPTLVAASDEVFVLNSTFRSAYCTGRACVALFSRYYCYVLNCTFANNSVMGLTEFSDLAIRDLDDGRTSLTRVVDTSFIERPWGTPFVLKLEWIGSAQFINNCVEGRVVKFTGINNLTLWCNQIRLGQTTVGNFVWNCDSVEWLSRTPLPAPSNDYCPANVTELLSASSVCFSFNPNCQTSITFTPTLQSGDPGCSALCDQPCVGTVCPSSVWPNGFVLTFDPQQTLPYFQSLTIEGTLAVDLSRFTGEFDGQLALFNYEYLEFTSGTVVVTYPSSIECPPETSTESSNGVFYLVFKLESCTASRLLLSF